MSLHVVSISSRLLNFRINDLINVQKSADRKNVAREKFKACPIESQLRGHCKRRLNSLDRSNTFQVHGNVQVVHG